jgi:hypothetical protein
VKVAFVAVAATVIETGSVTDTSSLARVMANPPVGAAALRVTVQESAPAPVIAPLEQVSALSVTTGVSCNANVSETLPSLAVKVAVCAEFTADAVAVKLALVAFAATVTDAGTVTDASLLTRFTTKPPLGAAPLSVTVQASVPAPVIAPLAQVNPLKAAAGLSCKVNVSERLPAVAVTVAV